MAEWETPVAVHSKCGESNGYEATRAIDEDTATSWIHTVYCYHWIIFDMGKRKNITKIRLYQSGFKGYRWGSSVGLLVYVSDDPEDFGEPVWEGILNATGWQESGSFSKKGRYIKLLNKNNSSMEQIFEFAAYAQALPCEEWLTQEECEAAGCYWYDGTCHSTPKTPRILATVGGIGLGAAMGYALKPEAPVVPMILGAITGGTVGFIIDRLRS